MEKNEQDTREFFKIRRSLARVCARANGKATSDCARCDWCAPLHGRGRSSTLTELPDVAAKATPPPHQPPHHVIASLLPNSVITTDTNIVDAFLFLLARCLHLPSVNSLGCSKYLHRRYKTVVQEVESKKINILTT